MPSTKTALKKMLWWSQKYNICLEMSESQKFQIKTKNKILKKSTDTQEIYLSTFSHRQNWKNKQKKPNKTDKGSKFGQLWERFRNVPGCFSAQLENKGSTYVDSVSYNHLNHCIPVTGNTLLLRKFYSLMPERLILIL